MTEVDLVKKEKKSTVAIANDKIIAGNARINELKRQLQELKDELSMVLGDDEREKYEATIRDLETQKN